MMLPPIIRVFFAIDLPQSIRDSVSRFMGSLKKNAKSHAIRWVRPENLHITLQFLAEVRAEHLSQMLANVRQELEGVVKNSSISFTEVHLFPSVFRPRVIVLGVKPQEELVRLAELIGRGIKASHYDIENRLFRPHLTLGRIKQPFSTNLKFLSAAVVPVMEAISVNEVALFYSEPRPEGSRYTVIERIGWCLPMT
ncbi:MAG: 2'-5' RNA ligase [Gammaproteobacteria bacterium RIFCSPHIGHO2_12_FULL_45_12]|nr:MAG: 2'-5' RNA ligase [Gammaproteobacteria bacterium RIFCSPHIGHO2_12_FULL_45_12]